MKNPGIYYDESGLQNILSSSKVESIEQDIMLQKKTELETAFLHEFGTKGSFRVSIIRSNNKTWNGGHRYAGRVIFRIVPDDKKTYAILRGHPGWIKRFIK